MHDPMYGFDLNPARDKGLVFWGKPSQNAIILQRNATRLFGKRGLTIRKLKSCTRKWNLINENVPRSILREGCNFDTDPKVDYGFDDISTEVVNNDQDRQELISHLMRQVPAISKEVRIDAGVIRGRKNYLRLSVTQPRNSLMSKAQC